MSKTSKILLTAAMNAATLARTHQGQAAVAVSQGLTADDINRAHHVLALMPQDVMTTAFDRRDYLIERGWRPGKNHG